MSNLKDVFYRIQYLDGKNEREFQKKIIKTMEELGELAAVYLEEDGYKLVEEKRTPEEIDKHKLEEGCDVLIQAFSLLAHMGYSLNQITDMCEHKCDVWEQKLKKNQLTTKNS
jgi:NTP pyrophosphatase (non-canonical NTP hydrolase)